MFTKFAKKVKRNAEAMSESKRFRAKVSYAKMKQAYQELFPEGTNPIYITNREHDCSCCNHFIRDLGGMVTINDGHIHTIWDDCDDLPHPYNVVAAGMAKLVRESGVKTIFYTKEFKIGVEKNTKDGIDFNHFHARIKPALENKRFDTYVQMLNTMLGYTTVELLDRTDAILGQVRRGTQYVLKLDAYRRFYNNWERSNQKDLYVLQAVTPEIAMFKNTPAGVLLKNLSDGLSDEVAKGKYEAMVAPENYRRSTGAVSQYLINKFRDFIKENGYEDSLVHRHSKLSDLSYHDILWTNSTEVADTPLDALVATKPSLPQEGMDLTIGELIDSVLPYSEKLELYYEPKADSAHLCSMLTPENPDAPHVLNWDSNHLLTYRGGYTDSLDQRIKSAGGAHDKYFTIALSWDYKTDLDLHVNTPDGLHLYYDNRGRYGIQDIDANAGIKTNNPVEHMRWDKDVPNGTYTVEVSNFDNSHGYHGFNIRVKIGEKMRYFSCSTPITREHKVLEVEVLDNEIVDIRLYGGIEEVSSEGMNPWKIAKGYKTVNVLCRSPNYWRGQSVGELHYFFGLEGVRNPDEIRSIYSEYLKDDFRDYRKVIEQYGDLQKCKPSEDQLTGLGYSQSVGGILKIKVDGRPFNLEIK